MKSLFVIALILLSILTLVYLWALFHTKQYRHSTLFIRLSLLILLFLLLSPLPETDFTSTQHLFVIIDTSKSMKTQLEVSKTEIDLQNILPSSIQETIKVRYKNHRKHYFDLYQLEKNLGKTVDITWTSQSPILRKLSFFLNQGLPSEKSQILLISDGLDTEFENIPQNYIKILKESGIKIDTLTLQYSPTEDDVEIQSVSNPRVVFKQSSATIRVSIHSSLSKAQSSDLILTDGTAILDKRTLELPQGDHTIQTELSWIPDKLGESLLFLRMVPLEHEKNHHNNVAYLPTNVRAKRLKVLHIAGRPGWDVHHLRILMKSIPGLDLSAFFILRDPFKDVNTVPENELSLIQFPVKALFEEELPKFDLVIFQNFPMETYMKNRSFQKSFQNYLSSGKKIIFVGGDQVVQQKKFQQLFIKEATEAFNLEFYSFPLGVTLADKQLPFEIHKAHPTYQGEKPQKETPPLIKITQYGLGQIYWILNPSLWQRRHLLNEEQIGLSGDYAAFWQTLIYQSEYEIINVFRDFRQRLPYTVDHSISGVLYLPKFVVGGNQSFKVQVIDQVLQTIVWENLIGATSLPIQKGTVKLELPPLSPSYYEMRLTCDCKAMSDITQSFIIVDEWLELHKTIPRKDWLKKVANLTGGELIEI